MQNGSRKLFWIGFILVFLFGLLGGAYLVLRSTITHGELANSTPASQGKSSDELLDELLKLNEAEQSGGDSEYIPPEDKNLTDGFLKTMTSEISENGGLSNTTAEEISSSDFIAGTVIPYIGENSLNLFPIIPNSILKIIADSKSAKTAYYKQTNTDAESLLNIIKDLMEFDADKLENGDDLNDLYVNKEKLTTIFQNFSKIAIPKSLVEIHKNMIVTCYSVQKSIEVLINSDEDPLKALIVFNNAEALGEFWKNSLLEYSKASK
jgi:hypothetical protein